MAAIAVEALTGDGHEGKIHPITGPEAISYDRVGEILSEVLGRKIGHVNIPEEDTRKEWEETGFPHWVAKSAIEADTLAREGRSSAVSPAVEEVTGRIPKSFEQFARDYAEAFR
ncbi:MAG: hypothetical protein ACE5JE_09385 [Thermoplasmata archaeon]